MDKPLKYFLMITSVFVLLIGVFIVASIVRPPVPPEGYVVLNENDPLIVSAKSKAASLIDSFQFYYEQAPKKTFVRFAFEPKREKVEHLWGNVLSMENARIKVGLLQKGNDPGVFYPDEIELKTEFIEDWLVEMPDGTIRGGFTSQAILMKEIQKPDSNKDSLNSLLMKFIDRL